METSTLFNILSAIEDASVNGALFEAPGLTGLSGKKILGTLQRLAKKLVNDRNSYLEVGIFQGLSLLSVAKVVDNGAAIGIDNFATFDKDGKNLSIVKERIQKLNATNVEIINKDYEDALEHLGTYLAGRMVSVYFVDGPHDYRSQLMCLLLIKPFLSDDAVIIVDDCNYRHVRQANEDFLKSNPEFKLIFEAYTRAHPSNLSSIERQEVENGWWDGINIIVKDSHRLIADAGYPSRFRDRTLYENEHYIHGSKYPKDIVSFLPFISAFRSKQYARALYRLYRLSLKQVNSDAGSFPSLNTYSESLPAEHFIVKRSDVPVLGGQS